MEAYVGLCEKIADLDKQIGNTEMTPDDRQLCVNEMTKLRLNLKKLEDVLLENKVSNTFNGNCRSMSEAVASIESQRQEIRKRRRQIGLLEKELHGFHNGESHNANEDILVRLESFFTDNKSDQKSKNLEGQRPQNLQEVLSNMKVVNSGRDVHTISLSYGNSGLTVDLELHYSKQKPPHPVKLIDINMRNCPVHAEDLVARAVSNNDFGSVIPDLQQRLQQGSALAEEIESLRKTCALDWIPEERFLKVMVRNYTCTLCVPDGYPAIGMVRLVSMKGLEEKQLEDFQPLADRPSLPDWVKHLELHLDG